MPDYGPLDAVEQVAVLETKLVMELKHLRESRVSLEASLRTNANEIARREGQYQQMLAQIVSKRGGAVAPATKIEVKRNIDGTVVLHVPT